MAELLGTGQGAPMIVDTRSGGDDMGFGGNNPLLWLITLGFLGRNGGLLGGGGGEGCGAAGIEAAIAQSTIQDLNTQFATSNQQGIQNQLNNIQADQVSNAQNVTNQLMAQNQNNDVKLLLTRLADGNTALASQLCDCCCENKILGLQNTAQIVGAVNGEGAATRALINQLDKENLLEQLSDAKLQISNLGQTIAITSAIDAKLDQIFPPRFFCNPAPCNAA